MIYLVEHFYSIQGEGKYIGSPSLFLRFGGCNMKCEGFGCIEELENGVSLKGCDTIYAVNKEHFAKSWKQITQLQELVDIVESYNLPQGTDIVLTGGEPLIYANDELFVLFLNELHKRGHQIHFETNGSLDVDFQKHPIYKKAIFALSVKLKNSGEKESKRLRVAVLKNIIANAKEAYFKLSIDANNLDNASEEEIANIAQISSATKLYCMPLGASKEEIELQSEALVEFCKTKGYNFGDRLHIRIWNKDKGV
jgi:organic radical activating enzyme